MSRLTGGNSAWPQTDPSYLMRFGPFAPWSGPPSNPRSASVAGEAVSHHHPAAGWGHPSPGPFGILPHQESVSPAPATASSAPYAFAAGAKSSLQRQHATEQYIAAAMNAAAHDQSYNRYQQVLGHMSMSSSRSPAASSSSRAMHQMHSAQYSAMNSFPGSDRLARDLMSASASSAAAAYSQQSQHQNNAVVGMDPNAMLMSSSAWYQSGMVPRMPVMSHRVPSASSGTQSRRSNDIISGSGPAAAVDYAAAAAWSSYSTGGHNQSIAMHQGCHSSKYPVTGNSSGGGSAYHSTSQQNSGSHNRGHSAASANNNLPVNSFNNYLSNCSMQMMNGLNHSSHLLQASAMMGHSSTHHQQHMNQQHAAANYPTASSTALSSSSGHGSAAAAAAAHNQRSGNVSTGSNSSSGHGSRSSSVTPNHNLPVVGQNSDSCPFSGYNSPSANSAHNSYSPYPGRSASAANNSSATTSHTPTPHGPSPVLTQSDPVSGYDSSGGSSGYSSSGPSQGYPVTTMQRLTPPSSGYPTPPASVSQAQVVTNTVTAPGSDDSSHGLQSHFPLTPQSGSSYYSSSSGYSSNSKCSTDSVVSAGSASGSSTTGNSCMVAAAAAAGYPSHMPHTMSSESGLAEATQPSACLTGMVDSHPAKGMNPGPVSITGGEADPNLGSVFTEQEIEFPSIGYDNEAESSAYSAMKVNQQSTPKKRKEKSKKDKKKKEKAKQVAAADRIALSSFAPFDVPVPHFSHQHSLNSFSGQVSLTPAVVMNPYLLTGHSMDQSDLMTHMGPGASFFTNNPNQSDLMNTLQSASSTQQMPSHHHQQHAPPHESASQQVDQALHDPAISGVPAQDQRLHEKDTFADLEDDLRLLTEGSQSTTCVQEANQQTAVSESVPTSGSSDEIEMAFTADSGHQIEATSHPANPNTSFSEEPVTVRIPDSVPLRNGLNSDSAPVAEDLLDFIQKNSEHENQDPLSLNSDACPSEQADAESDVPAAKKKKKKSKDHVAAVAKGDKSDKATISSSSSHQTQVKAKVKSEESLKPKKETRETERETYIPILPQGKSSSQVHESTSMHHQTEKKIAASPAAAGDSKFFKNRPQNVIPATEKRTDSVICNGTGSQKKGAVSAERTVPAKKRKAETNIRNQSLHDEYEFRESPSETSRKRAKKAVPSVPAVPAVVVVPPKSGKKSVSNEKSAPAASPHSLPVPSLPAANSKKQSAKSAKSNSSKSHVKIEPLPQNSIRCPPSPQKCDSSRSLTGSAAPAPSLVPPAPAKSASKVASNSVTKLTVQQKTSPNSGKEGKAITTSPAPPPKAPLSLKSCDTQPVVQSLAPKSNHVAVNGSSKKENAKTGNVSVQSMGTNTPRKRSQDKKTLTIKEGLMRPHEFVVSIDEMNQPLPMIWRIEGKSLLQRFEPTLQDGQTVYINTSSYSAWNPTVRQRYRGVDVKLLACSRTTIVVEMLGLTKSHPPSNQNGEVVLLDKTKLPQLNGTLKQEVCFEHFAVFIQTLISQALDSNFIAEIVQEDDKYFLDNMREIDGVCDEKKQLFFNKLKWEASVVKCIETFPTVNIIPQKNENDLRCRLCHDMWSTLMFNFTGLPYDPQTLEAREVSDIKQTKYAACDACKDRVLLFSRLHHSKFNFFQKCQEKVKTIRSDDGAPITDPELILGKCLDDNDWTYSLYREMEEIWFYCDKFSEITKTR